MPIYDRPTKSLISDWAKQHLTPGQVNAAIASCDGDPRAAARALIVANNFLTEHVDALSKVLDYAWRWISPGLREAH
jgi:hypothetical protein